MTEQVTLNFSKIEVEYIEPNSAKQGDTFHFKDNLGSGGNKNNSADEPFGFDSSGSDPNEGDVGTEEVTISFEYIEREHVIDTGTFDDIIV